MTVQSDLMNDLGGRNEVCGRGTAGDMAAFGLVARKSRGLNA